MVCRNHADRKARRNCFLCKIPICPGCQKKANHHIFCGDSCSKLFAERNELAGEVGQQLQALDQSINDDIREFGDEITESFASKLEKLEDALDRALTELATMVEGSAVAASEELKQAVQKNDTQYQTLERTSKQRGEKLSDAQESLKQLSIQTRELVLEFKEQVEAYYQRNEQHAELFQNRFGHIEKELEDKTSGVLSKIEMQIAHFADMANANEREFSGLKKSATDSAADLRKRFEDAREMMEEKQAHLLERVESKMDWMADTASEDSNEIADRIQDALEASAGGLKNHQEQIAKWLADQKEVVERQVVKMGEFGEELTECRKDVSSQFSKQAELLTQQFGSHKKAVDELSDTIGTQTGSIEKSLKTNTKHLEDSFERVSGKLHDQISTQLKKIVDDVALLAVAQRGNWQDVVSAAQKGAEVAAKEARPEVIKRMNTEIEAMARHQARELSRVITEVQADLKKKVHRDDSFLKTAGYSFAGVLVGFAIALPIASSFFSKTEVVAVSSPAPVQQDVSQVEGLKEWVNERLLQFEKNAPKAETGERLSMIPVPSMTRGNVNRKEVAFTFDAGSNANAATEILDTLAARNIKATMFLTGAFIDQFPNVVKRIANEGHEAGNHLLEHNHVVDPKTRHASYKKEEFVRQLTEVEKKYKATTGKEMSKLWRAPYGEISDEVIGWAAAMGYRHIGWTRSNGKNLDTMDWVADPKNALYKSADQIAEKILKIEKEDGHGLNGAVVLMHLGTERTSDFPHKKLPAILDEVAKRGYQIVPVSQVLRTDVALK